MRLEEISIVTITPASASAEQRLKESGIALPAPPMPSGTYAEAVRTGNLLLVSGMLPTESGAAAIVGRLDAGHFALDTAADEIAALVDTFLGQAGAK